MARGGKPLQIYLPETTIERIRQLADTNRRTLTAEVEIAIERHLAAPILMEAAPPPPAIEPPPRKPMGRPRKNPEAPEQPKRPRGRPRKEQT